MADSSRAGQIAVEISNIKEIIAVIGNKNSSTLESVGSWYERIESPS